MKTKKWLQFSSLCLILSLTVACGGKNSSGGGGGGPDFNAYKSVSSSDSGVLPSRFMNTYQGEQIASTFNQVLSWRNQSSENGDIIGTGFTRGQIYGTTSNNNCSTGTFLKFFDYQYCKNGSNQNSTVSFSGTPTQVCTVKNSNNKLVTASVNSTAIPYNVWGCSLSNYTEYSKDQNNELNKVLSLNNGSWHIYGTQRSGNTVYLLVGEKNVGPSLMYGIDMSYHSVYNPVSIQNVSTGVTTKSMILQ